MVALEVALDRHLPVGAGHHARGEQVALVELECLEHGTEVAQPRVDVDRQTGGQAHEDDARGLDAGKLDEIALGLVEVAERLLAVETVELAVHAVRPCVVRAHERTRLTVSGLADERAAMAAHVEHRVNLALGIARDENRDTHDLDGLVGVLLRELARQCQRQRDALEDEVDLGLEQFLVEVVVDRLLPRLGRLIGGLVPGVRHEPAHHRDGLFARGTVEHRAGQVLRNDHGLLC